MLLPSSLVISQGWGLIDLPLRAPNEGSPLARRALHEQRRIIATRVHEQSHPPSPSPS